MAFRSQFAVNRNRVAGAGVGFWSDSALGEERTHVSER